MYTISKTFHFSAAHQLHTLDEGHPCARLHGHNYEVRVVLRAERLDEHGMVLDYRKLDVFKKWLDDTCDHRHLNDVCPYYPTAENLARWFYEVLHELHIPASEVCVKETPKTEAIYSPGHAG